MSANDILILALQLSEEDRASLVQKLLLSLEPEAPEPGHEEEWQEVILARLNSVEEGTFTATPWREAIERMRQALHRGSAS